MTGGAALAAQAIGGVARRDLASEWGGADPASRRDAARRLAPPREGGKRIAIRKP